ncbi:hypothetical protein SCB49_07042 [unidentified eubacterium SCB49]|nr:hypothetical protein SCB49_07042 [unidentified eubacterium SCB49]
MKTSELFTLLKDNDNKALLFGYNNTALVAQNYHITEVKHTAIKAVDCGGKMDEWNETIIQLLEPETYNGEAAMSCFKAAGILNKVGKMAAYDMNATVKFEYGNANYHTAHLPVEQVLVGETKIIIQLGTDTTQCKAPDTCGLPLEKATTNTENTCTPGGGCC